VHDRLVSLLRNAERIVVFTGAGISTNSGIPDYRGPKGVWKTSQPVMYQDFMSDDAARREYWSQKLHGWEAFRDAEPNDVHRAVVDLERAGKVTAVVTQNIDGLHAKAGTSADRLVEIHGTNRQVECQTCHTRSDPQAHFDAFRATGDPPICSCGGWLKPATISFGQALRPQDMQDASAAASSADLALSMGSTLSVHPAASVPLLAVERGAKYVIINRGPTEQDAIADLRLEGDVSALLVPAVAAALKSRDA
jgi:NAD-dependent protein deacetylase/lipoamidase